MLPRLLVRSEVEIELDELDATVTGELTDHGEPREEDAGRDENPILPASRDQLRKLVEPVAN